MRNLFLTFWYAVVDEVKSLVHDVRQPENGEAVNAATGGTLAFATVYLLTMLPYFM